LPVKRELDFWTFRFIDNVPTMALDLNTISFVGTAIKLAWEIYDKGFKKEKSSRW
jgi:hypothetical protein